MICKKIRRHVSPLIGLLRELSYFTRGGASVCDGRLQLNGASEWERKGRNWHLDIKVIFSTLIVKEILGNPSQTQNQPKCHLHPFRSQPFNFSGPPLACIKNYGSPFDHPLGHKGGGGTFFCIGQWGCQNILPHVKGGQKKKLTTCNHRQTSVIPISFQV